MTFAASGALLEVEQEIDRDSLPATVAQALTQAAKGGKVLKVESLTKGASVSSYEAVVLQNGHRREVALSPEGKTVRAD